MCSGCVHAIAYICTTLPSGIPSRWGLVLVYLEISYRVVGHHARTQAPRRTHFANGGRGGTLVLPVVSLVEKGNQGRSDHRKAHTVGACLCASQGLGYPTPRACLCICRPLFATRCYYIYDGQLATTAVTARRSANVVCAHVLARIPTMNDSLFSLVS